MENKTLTITKLRNYVEGYLKADKTGTTKFTPSFSDITQLIDTIGKIYTIEQTYTDKLPELSGEDIPYGRTIEEYFTDLVMPQPYNPKGDNSLAPSDATYRAPYYTFPLERVMFKQTLRYNEFEKSVHNAGQFANLTSSVLKALYDGKGAYEYSMKRQLLGNIAKKLAVAPKLTNDTTSSAWKRGDIKRIANDWYVAYNDYTGTVKDGVKSHDLMPLKCVSTNTTWTFKDHTITSDNAKDFIKQIKFAVEEASDISEGNSLSGNTLGNNQSNLKLYVTQGVEPLLDTEVLASTFHVDKYALPASLKTIKDFGDQDEIVAILIDPRGIKLHRNYFAARDQVNAEGDWISYYLHAQYTGFISCNTFIRVFTCKDLA